MYISNRISSEDDWPLISIIIGSVSGGIVIITSFAGIGYAIYRKKRLLRTAREPEYLSMERMEQEEPIFPNDEIENLDPLVTFNPSYESTC